ncbi:cell growth regulator with RING finger domain protein 1-like isoform X2 [Macrosteles quadrilineatus]|uniref:cell growth regulator with RING finger domain protein 1-like isoform X2 n=1 Tax=Macrosteles quadrilineatus TaxID=74068 RepID=UPI0023E311DF|nr:cell growth regulator with RING finger domain protein 1-like isoform X2 [Macrosteles quadrilineatus]
MLVAMTAMLVSVAELSNILSVLAVLICFCGMVLFIMRNMTVFWLHGEELMFGGSVHHVQPRIPQMKMMKVHIPFTFKLQETSKSSYKDLQYSVSSQVPYTLQAFWGVSIRELHLFLWRPWSAIEAAARQDCLLKGHYQRLGTCIWDGAHGERQQTMTLPTPPLELGTPPRLCYPLVIFLIRNNPGTLHPDETVALINVIHIKDSVCTLPTSILAQYLKQANGQLSCLKQLYLATGNPQSYEDDDRPVVVGEQLCVVCQYFPLSRALLPCRHTCVCASCFAKLQSCPMCRSPINSYFCIRSEEYLPATEDLHSPSKPEPLSQWLQDRLTDFLGFHR